MDFYRINDKIISLQKISDKIKKILDLRSKGLSQAEVADIVSVDRSFISRIEGIGEVRKGRNIAVIGFPIKNKQEVEEVLEQYGIGFYLLMTEHERNNFINSMSAAELLEVFSRYLEKFKMYDVVIAMGSDFRLNWFKAFLDNEVISIPLGKSPLKNDVYVDIDSLKKILSNIIS
ncbi:helix-turn-helix domain-containing protein [Caldicellulosiruptoraceae bacterium PP1]